MTQHPIHTLPPEQLRGYARGLREASSLVPPPGERLRAYLEREAEMVEGFAERLDGATREAAPSTPATPAAPWYQLDDDLMSRREGSLLAMLQANGIVEGYCVRVSSSQWDGFRWAAWAGDAAYSHEAFTADTTDELLAHLTELRRTRSGTRCAADEQTYQAARDTAATQDEAAQTGLAEAVAESLAASVPDGPKLNASGWPAETVERARQLFIGGMTYQKVSDETGVPVGTISGWAAKKGWIAERQPTEPAAAPEAPAHGAADAILSARREKAHSLFLLGIKPRDIAAQIGIPEGSINAWASTRGWRKELAVLQAFAAESKPPVLRPVHALIPEEEAEAREMLRTGKAEGAKDLAEWFGCSLEAVQPIVDAHRAGEERAA